MLPRFTLVLLCWVSVPVQAQPAVTPDTPRANSVDVQVLRAVYGSPPGVASVWRVADWTSYKVFIGAPTATWAAALAGHVEPAFAYRVTLAEGAALVSYYGIKNLFRRARPYRVVPGIASRRSHGTEELEMIFDPYSFPSGHAAAAFVLATTYALEYRHWYVVVPGAVWATSVGLSRVWLGVHYPSDVLVGAALGAGLALTVHLLAEAVTPSFLDDDPAATVPLVTLRIPLR